MLPLALDVVLAVTHQSCQKSPAVFRFLSQEELLRLQTKSDSGVCVRAGA